MADTRPRMLNGKLKTKKTLTREAEMEVRAAEDMARRANKAADPARARSYGKAALDAARYARSTRKQARKAPN